MQKAELKNLQNTKRQYEKTAPQTGVFEVWLDARNSSFLHRMVLSFKVIFNHTKRQNSQIGKCQTYHTKSFNEMLQPHPISSIYIV